MRELKYHTTTIINLSNEDYTNAGLTREEVREVINNIPGVLDCRNSGINHNVDIVPYSAFQNSYGIAEIVWEVEVRLENLIKSKEAARLVAV